MKKFITLALFLGFASPILQADDAYVVNSGIYYNETLIAKPVLTVLPGQQATIEASFAEDDAYRLAITVHPIDDANINIVANLKLAGESLSLSMVLELGQPGQIRTGTRRLDLIVEK